MPADNQHNNAHMLANSPFIECPCIVVSDLCVGMLYTADTGSTLHV